MSVSVMMGEQGREAFAQAIRNGPPPMSENERRAMAAQIYPALLPEVKPRDESEGFASDPTSKNLS